MTNSEASPPDALFEEGRPASPPSVRAGILPEEEDSEVEASATGIGTVVHRRGEVGGGPGAGTSARPSSSPFSTVRLTVTN